MTLMKINSMTKCGLLPGNKIQFFSVKSQMIYLFEIKVQARSYTL